MKRAVRYICEGLAGLFGLLVILSMGLMWRLNEAPISTTFMTPTLQVAVNNLLGGSQTEIEKTLLEWDNAARTISLHAENIRVTLAGRGTIAIIPSLDVGLNPFALMLGQFIPRQFNLDHPQIEIDRHSDGKLYFGDMEAATPAVKGNSPFEGVQTLAHNLTTAIFTRELRVSNLIIDIHDEATHKGWALRVPELVLDRVGGQVAGHATIEVTQAGEIAKLAAQYTYDPRKQRHRLSASMDNIVPAQMAGGHPNYVGLPDAAVFNMPITGNVTAEFDKTLSVLDASIDLQGGAGTLVIPELWDAPRAVTGMVLQAHYQPATGVVEIAKADLDYDHDTKSSFAFTGHLTADRHLQFQARVAMQNLWMDQLERSWPKPVLPNARDWIIRNMHNGAFTKVEGHAEGDVPLDHLDLDHTQISDAGCHIVQSGASINFLDGLPLATGVDAEADCDLHDMHIQIKSGGIAGLKTVPFPATISGLMDDTQYLDLPAKINGNIHDALALIDHAPLGYAHAAGVHPDDITGNLDATASFKFPLLKALQVKDVAVNINANLVNVSSRALVKGRELTQGNLAMHLTTAGMNFKGNILLNKIPLQVTAEQNFFPTSGQPYRQAQLTGTIRDEQWQALGIEALKGTRGAAAVKVQITTSTNRKNLISGALDMTTTDIHLDQLNWHKPAGTMASLKFSADAIDGKDINVSNIELLGAGLNAKGHATLAPSGDIKHITLDPFILGRSNASVSMTQSAGPDGLLRLDVSGASFDVTGMRNGHDIARQDPRPKEYHLHLGTLYTSDKGFIAPFDGFAIRDTAGWGAIDLHGDAEGAHPLAIELIQQDGIRHFNVICDNFGEALKGMGFTDTVHEGDLKISGASTIEHPRVIEGNIKIGGFVVHQLPVMALLLNATSPFGFTDLLTDSASFDRLEGKFRWEGDAIDLQGVRAAGSSVGMNIDGHVDMDTGAAKLHGTMVPFRMVNGLLESIPLLGDLLTGGEGQGVLAVSYSINGTLDQPKIDVHAGSLLTPGFLRNLFFSDEN